MNKRWRHLTESEIQTAQRIFADAVDYQKVRIYRGIPYLPTTQTAVSPNGHIYFPRCNCPHDFTQASANHQMWLIHEMTHVWQFQNGFQTWYGGFFLLLTGGYFRRKAYVYPKFSAIRHFGRLNMEQQADLLAHYYAAKYLSCNPEQAADFQTILAVFLDNPHNKANLPVYHSLEFYWC